jgi:hypothetical protein
MAKGKFIPGYLLFCCQGNVMMGRVSERRHSSRIFWTVDSLMLGKSVRLLGCFKILASEARISAGKPINFQHQLAGGCSRAPGIGL